MIPGLGRSPGERKGYPLQYSGLENSMDYIHSPRGHKESDTTERPSLSLSIHIHTHTLDVSSGELRELVMDKEARRAAIHGVAKSRTRLSD